MKQIIKLIGTISLFTVCFLLILPQISTAGPSFWKEMDLPGHDFRNFSLHRDYNEPPLQFQGYFQRINNQYEELAHECRRACEQDTRCKAWTFVRGDDGSIVGRTSQGTTWRLRGRCWLKDDVPEPVVNRICISGVKPPPPTVQAHPRGWEVHIDRPGGDYRNFPQSRNNPAECQEACQRDPRCRAWTSVQPDRRRGRAHCWLKDTVPAHNRDDRCVSGVKR